MSYHITDTRPTHITMVSPVVLLRSIEAQEDINIRHLEKLPNRQMCVSSPFPPPIQPTSASPLLVVSVHVLPQLH